MKTWISLICIGSLAAVLTLGSVVSAKANDEIGEKGQEQGVKIDKMKTKLGLTDDQVTKIKALKESRETETEPLHKQMKADMKTLAAKVKAKASEVDIKAALDAVRTDQENIETAKKKHMDQMEEILTPTQQAKFLLHMKEHGEKGEKEKKDSDGKDKSEEKDNK